MQKCPHCQKELSAWQLFALDANPIEKCEECGGFLRNAHTRLIAFLLILPFFFWFLGAIKDHSPFWLLLVIALPFIKILLTKPIGVKYELAAPCLRCHRPSALYRSPCHRVCDDC